jgi:hypothetical protein
MASLRLLVSSLAAGVVAASPVPSTAVCEGGSLPACVSACPAGAAFTACLASCNNECTKPTSALFIGNSLTFWNRGTHVHVQALAAAAGYPLDVAECTIGGATLGTLWRRSAPVGGNRCTLNNTPRESIATGDFQVVVMQEDMPELQPRQIPEGIEPFFEYARLFAAEIRSIGSTPLFCKSFPVVASNPPDRCMPLTLVAQTWPGRFSV